MMYGILLFAFLSFVFSSPKWRWLINPELSLSPREEQIGFLFGEYLRDAAVVMLFLWLLGFLNLSWIYWLAGGVLFLRTLGLLVHMARVFIND